MNIFCLLCFLLSLSSASGNLKICSFNVKWFSQSKVDDHTVLDPLLKIILQCDIFSILEVRSADAVRNLVVEVNKVATDSPYGYVISAQVGRTTHYKENYAILYRQDAVSMQREYLMDDTYDQFEREPFSVAFHSSVTHPSDFVLIVFHSKPNETRAELESLVSATENITQYFDVQNALIAGDLNADCRYLSHHAYAANRLVQDSRFLWLIDSDIDTTVGVSNCAYDRFIAFGSEIRNGLVSNSAKVFDFEKEFQLSHTMALLYLTKHIDQNKIHRRQFSYTKMYFLASITRFWVDNVFEAYHVSDHFPIEIELKTN